MSLPDLPQGVSGNSKAIGADAQGPNQVRVTEHSTLEWVKTRKKFQFPFLRILNNIHKAAQKLKNGICLVSRKYRYCCKSLYYLHS